MNQVDFFVLVVVGVSALSGARRGLVNAAGDIVSLLIGLMLGSLTYPAGAALLRVIFGLTPPIAGALGFIMMAVLTVLLAGWGIGLLASRFELSRPINRAGGAGFGAAFGCLFAGILVIASAVMPGAAASIGDSALAPRMIALVPSLHENMESVGVALPKLVHLPDDYRDEVAGLNRGMQFLRINFSRLEGATCINCRGPVDFEGYQFSRGTLMSPRFRCTHCERTSDGCQTFEGFHAIYRGCPVPLAKEGLQFDCGVWTNGWWTVPAGVCPVCGEEYQPLRPARPTAEAQPENRLRLSKSPDSMHHSGKVARCSPAYS